VRLEALHEEWRFYGWNASARLQIADCHYGQAERRFDADGHEASSQEGR